MAVKPTGVSSAGTFFNPLLHGQNSLISQARQTVEWYFSNHIDIQSTVESVDSIVQQAIDIDNISMIREVLCILLQLNIPEIEKSILNHLENYFNFSTYTFDVQQNQYSNLLSLEQILNTLIEDKIRSKKFDSIERTVILYLRILERLWLIPHLSAQGNECAQLRDQHRNNIIDHINKCAQLLPQLVQEKGFNKNLIGSLEGFVYRIFNPIPSDYIRLINEIRGLLRTHGGVSTALLEVAANIYRDQKDYYLAIDYGELSLEFLKEGLEENPNSLARKAILQTMMSLTGNLCSWCLLLDRSDRSILYGQEMLRLAKVLGDPGRILDCLQGLGALYTLLGKDDLAIPCYKDARLVARSLQNLYELYRILRTLAKLYTDTGQYPEAMQNLDEAFTLADDDEKKAAVFLGRSVVYRETNRYDDAIRVQIEALSQVSSANHLVQASIHENLGQLYRNIGNYEKAIFHAQKALDLVTQPYPEMPQTKALHGRVGALLTLGTIYGILGDLDRELDFQKQALGIAEKRYRESSMGSPDKDIIDEDFRKVSSSLGVVLSRLERFSESLPHFHNALKLSRNGYDRCNIHANMGTSFLSCDKLPEAVQHLEGAAKTDRVNAQITALNGLGLAYGKMNNRPKAVQSLQQSLELCRNAKDRFNEAGVHQNLAEFYRNAKEYDLAEKNYRFSLDIFASLQEGIGDYSQWQITIFEEQCKPYVRLESLLLEQGRKEEAFEASEMRRARALNSALIRKFPANEQALLTSKVVKLSDAQEYAKSHNTVLIFYSFAMIEDGKIAIWVVPPSGKMSCYTFSYELIKEEIEDLSKLFEGFPFMNQLDNSSGTTEAQAQIPVNPKLAAIKERARRAAAEGFKQKLRNWYQTFIAPIEAELAQYSHQTLTIIPDDYLFRLPFAIFLDKDGKYLIEKHSIALAPSLKFLQLLSLLKNEAYSNESLIIGNPDTGEIKDRLEKAEREAVDLSHLLHVDSESLFLQKKATVETTIGRLPRAKWIHLACHGLPGPKLEPHSVFEGAFKLAPSEAYPQGYLYAQKIVELKLRAELVFLNACYSGVGKIKQEGSVGHTWSFLAAGAQSVIAAHWRVPETDLTLEMIKIFYKHIHGIDGTKTTKVEALRQAVLFALKENKGENPHLWGLFYIAGIS